MRQVRRVWWECWLPRGFHCQWLFMSPSIRQLRRLACNIQRTQLASDWDSVEPCRTIGNVTNVTTSQKLWPLRVLWRMDGTNSSLAAKIRCWTNSFVCISWIPTFVVSTECFKNKFVRNFPKQCSRTSVRRLPSYSTQSWWNICGRCVHCCPARLVPSLPADLVWHASFVGSLGVSCLDIDVHLTAKYLIVLAVSSWCADDYADSKVTSQMT